VTVVNLTVPTIFGVCCSHQNQNEYIVSQWKFWKYFLCTFVVQRK